MNSADGNDFRHWLIACMRDAFCGYGWRLRKCGSHFQTGLHLGKGKAGSAKLPPTGCRGACGYTHEM